MHPLDPRDQGIVRSIFPGLHTRRTALKLKKKKINHEIYAYILRSSLCLTAVYLVQCLRSQTAILSTPEFFFLLTGFFLSQGKKSFFLFIFFFCALFSFFIFERILAFLGVTTALSTFIWKVSSGSNESGNSGGETSLPALESSSSSESLATFRAVIAAENEA